MILTDTLFEIRQRLSFVLEELLHQLAAFLLEDAGGNCTFRVQGTGGIAAVAALLVATAVDYARYL